MADFDDAVRAKNALSRRLLLPQVRWRRESRGYAVSVSDARKNASRNLHGVGVGYKIVEGKKTRNLCVRLYVIQKLADSVVPKSARLPTQIFGIPTDVIEAPQAVFHLQCSARRRKLSTPPLVAGVSAAHRHVNLGTFGCFCTSLLPADKGSTFMLSCNHTFANMNTGAIMGGNGEPIMQPSVGDGGTVTIATLARSIPLKFGGTVPNTVDAAIAKLNPQVPFHDEICSIGGLKGVTQPRLDMHVRKHGRTTGRTEGIISDPVMDAYVIGYPGTVALFLNMIRTDPIPTLGYHAPPSESGWNDWFAAPGDSGSVLVDKASRKAVGLHFAGDYGVSNANPMTAVCNALRITIP